MSRAICAALVCGLAAAGPARAEPRTDPTEGRAVFAGAATPSATSIDVNPAALALGTTNEVYLGGSLVLDSRSIDTRTLDLASGALSRGPSIHDTQAGPGGLLALVLHYKDSATFAAAFHSYPIDMFPSGHADLEYQTLGGGERIYSAKLSSSFKLTDELYFGVSIATARRQLHLRYARDTALEAGHGPGGVDSSCGSGPCGLGNPNATEIYDVDVQAPWTSLDAFTVDLGALYVLGKDMYLAAAYHFQPGVDLVEYGLTGRMTVTRAPRDGGTTVAGGATVNVQEPTSVDAEFRSRIIGPYELHVGFRWENLSRFQAYDVRGYGSTFPSNGIPEWTERPRGYRDPFALWAGVEQVDAGGVGVTNPEAWRFGGRLGFETASVDDARTSPITIDPLSFTVDVGAAVRFSDSWVLQLTYGLQYYLPVSVTNSAFDPRDRLDCIDSGYDYSTQQCQNTRLGYAIATAAGDYGRIEHALALALRWKPPW
ncbi:MAG: outer membrane protein transport protein [Acidobacteriota bacterium]